MKHSGTTFYTQNGYKAIIVKLPVDTAKSLWKRANMSRCKRQELYTDILKDFVSNRDKYKMNGRIDGEKFLSIYITDKLHESLCNIAIDNNTSLKNLVATVLSAYINKRSYVETKR